MPFDEVFKKFGEKKLHSGSKKGPVVKNPKQAVAIMFSEKEKAMGGKSEYKSKSKRPSLKGLKNATK